MAGDVRFIRKNGRIIPIRSKKTDQPAMAGLKSGAKAGAVIGTGLGIAGNISRQTITRRQYNQYGELLSEVKTMPRWAWPKGATRATIGTALVGTAVAGGIGMATGAVYGAFKKRSK